MPPGAPFVEGRLLASPALRLNAMPLRASPGQGQILWLRAHGPHGPTVVAGAAARVVIARIEVE